MRLAFAAGALCLSLVGIAGPLSPSTTIPPAPAPAPSAVAPSAAASATASDASAALNGDAAAKHAKRTSCLKDAKTKKLVGAEKTSFLKSCIATP
jgi:psiF repeat